MAKWQPAENARVQTNAGFIGLFRGDTKAQDWRGTALVKHAAQDAWYVRVDHISRVQLIATKFLEREGGK